MKTDFLLKIINVNFSYNGVQVLENINLDIEKGEFLGIIGPNGSGKTTLLKIILGLLKPKSGRVEIFGENAESLKLRSKIGYVPQKSGSNLLQFPITVSEAVGMGRVKNKWLDFTTQGDKEAIQQTLKAVNMEDHKNKLLRELSGGEQQRIFIARALVSKPEILILDEPTVGVDLSSQSKFYKLLRDLNLKYKLTLILVSHDIGVVAHQVNELACINCRLICHGKPKDVLKNEFMEKLYGKDLRFVVHEH